MRHNVVTIFILSVFAAAAASSYPRLVAHAGIVEDLKQKISSGASDVANLEKEIQQYKTQITTTGKQADSLKSTIQTLDLTDKKLTTDIKVTEKKIDITAATVQTLQYQIGSKESQIEKNHAEMAELVRGLNVHDDTTLLEVALVYNSFSDFWNTLTELDQFQGGITAHVNDIKELKASLENNKQKKEDEKNQLQGLKSNLNDQHVLVETNKQEKAVLLAQTKSKQTEYQKLLADRLKKKQALEDEIKNFEEQLKVTIDPNSLPSSGTHVLHYPVDSVVITQYFGTTPFSTANPQVYGGKGHNGIDLGVPIGTPVHAALDGTVVDTGDTDIGCAGVSFGRWVLIRHNNGLTTLYAHLSVFKTSAGQSVSTGDLIGYSGNTGYSTGPHVHFTVYASKGVQVSNSYKSKVCGTNMKIPLSPTNGYLNPLSFL